jgi:2-dehydropantoate 2-reductase
VGGLLAALLSRADHRVICVAGEETAHQLRRHGIQVRSDRHGDFTAEVEADTVLWEDVDLCLVAVKHTALGAALDRIPPETLHDGLVLPLLNGVEHLAVLRARYGADRVVPATIRVESTRTAPGVIEHGSAFTPTSTWPVLGSVSPGSPSAASEPNDVTSWRLCSRRPSR